METKLADERNLLRALIDNLPDSIYMKDAAARKTLANKANLRIWDAKPKPKSWARLTSIFLPRKSPQNFLKTINWCFRKASQSSAAKKGLSIATGEVFWMLTTKVPWRDAAGNIVGIIGGGRNITKQKEAEIKLIDERNLLRTVIDNLPDAIYAKDMAARKTLANPADLKNLGCQTEAEALGKNDFEFFPKEVAEKFFEDDQLVLQNGQSVINREEKCHCDGRKIRLAADNENSVARRGRSKSSDSLASDATSRTKKTWKRNCCAPNAWKVSDGWPPASRTTSTTFLRPS